MREAIRRLSLAWKALRGRLVTKGAELAVLPPLPSGQVGIDREVLEKLEQANERFKSAQAFIYGQGCSQCGKAYERWERLRGLQKED